MARLNGFRERRVVWRYALRNALAPSVQVFAQNIQYLVGGIIVVEYLFAYPGLGKELVDAVAIRDVREVQSIADPDRGRLHPRSTSSRTCSSCFSSRSCGPAMRERLRFARTGAGAVGLALLALVVAIALFGPFVAPHAPDQPIGMPLTRTELEAPLGTDLARSRRALARPLGRTERSRARGQRDADRVRRRRAGRARRRLHRSFVDPMLMRGADVLLSFPALVFLLVLVTGLGTSAAVLVLGVAMIQMPPSRASSARRRSHSRSEASSRRQSPGGRARARSCGESSCRTSSRRSWPTSGSASRYSIILVASVNFLGLGPAAAVVGLGADDQREPLGARPQPARDPRTGGADRPPHDRGEPRRRRDRPQSGQSSVGVRP